MSFATKCWACGSSRFQETINREYCPDCGIECAYHGGGMNDKYKNASDAKHRYEAELAEEKFQKQWEADWGPMHG